MPQQSTIRKKPMITPLGKSITKKWMTSTEQPDQIFFPTTEIGRSVK